MRASVLLAALAASLARVDAQTLPDDLIQKVTQRLAEGAQRSWELGTRAHAILSLNATAFSAFTNASLPPSTSAPGAISPVPSMAHDIVSKLNSTSGVAPLMDDGSAADPAANGISVLLANWTGYSQGGKEDYAGAAKAQLAYLLEKVPRTSDGALSHRNDQTQLWSDFVSMVPPFFAYMGTTTENKTLLSEAYTQIKLYRDHLRDTHANNLWKHVVLGSSANDEGHWSTGNGWAAFGMLRVQGTIVASAWKDDFKNERKDLASWVDEILGGMYKHLPSSNIFTNYADQGSSFPDAASTALLAASVYRHALLNARHTHLPQAERSRQTLSSSPSSNNFAHFDGSGWLTPVVDPHAYGDKGAQSAEAQAFVLEMHAAHAAWVDQGSPGANAAARAGPALLPAAAALVWAAVLLLGAW